MNKDWFEVDQDDIVKVECEQCHHIWNSYNKDDNEDSSFTAHCPKCGERCKQHVRPDLEPSVPDDQQGSGEKMTEFVELDRGERIVLLETLGYKVSDDDGIYEEDGSRATCPYTDERLTVDNVCIMSVGHELIHQNPLSISEWLDDTEGER